MGSSTSKSVNDTRVYNSLLNDFRTTIQNEFITRIINTYQSDCTASLAAYQRARILIMDSNITNLNISNIGVMDYQCVSRNINNNDVQNALANSIMNNIASMNNTIINNFIKQRAEAPQVSITSNKSYSENKTIINNSTTNRIYQYLDTLVKNEFKNEIVNNCKTTVVVDQSPSIEIYGSDIQQLAITNYAANLTRCLFDNMGGNRIVNNLANDFANYVQNTNNNRSDTVVDQYTRTKNIFDSVADAIGKLTGNTSEPVTYPPMNNTPLPTLAPAPVAPAAPAPVTPVAPAAPAPAAPVDPAPVPVAPVAPAATSPILTPPVVSTNVPEGPNYIMISLGVTIIALLIMVLMK
jgi:hypothetical protein